MLSIPSSFDIGPETFHRIGMYPISFPLFTPINCFMFHLFTDAVVSFKLVGIEFSIFDIDNPLNEVSDCLTRNIRNQFCYDFPTARHSTNNSVLCSATPTLTGFTFFFVIVFSTSSTDIGFICFHKTL